MRLAGGNSQGHCPTYRQSANRILNRIRLTRGMPFASSNRSVFFPIVTRVPTLSNRSTNSNAKTISRLTVYSTKYIVIIMRLSLILLTPRLLFGQTFDAASVKAARLPAEATWMTRGGPGTKDPGRITYAGVPMRSIVMTAYGLAHGYEISCPAWMESLAFDIVATFPPGTSREQFQGMFRRLLAERFGMKLHLETREVPGYELILARGGSKLKAPEIASSPPPDGVDAGDGRIVRPAYNDKKGLPELPPGRNTLATFAIFAGGGVRISARMQSLPDIAEYLVRQRRTYFQEERPIVDRTGLTGKYDFNLDFARPGASPAASEEPESEFSIALEEQLGLRLVPRKVPVSVLVVDRAERIPTEN